MDSNALPQVSIVIPVRNAARHLRECLDSVLSQTLRDIEVICVDNGSTDASPAILSEYAGKDDRVRVVRDDSGNGAGAARNAGLAVANGKWLHFVDADDVVRREAEETLVGLAEQAGADVVVFGAEEYDDPTGLVTPLPLDLSVDPRDEAFLRAYATCPWNKLFRRAFLSAAGIVFQEIPRSNDLAFTVEALCRAERIAVLDQALYRYRIHGGGLQETKRETPTAWREAMAEARRRLAAIGVFDRFRAAFEILEADVRLANAESFPSRVVASIRRRGAVSFLKHAIGRLWRLMLK